MATYNLQYRGGKLKAGVRDSLLTIARVARKPRSPRHSSQSKENNAPLDTTTCMEPQGRAVNEPESIPAYFFRARKSIHRPKAQHHLASRDLSLAMHNDATVDSLSQPHPDTSDLHDCTSLQDSSSRSALCQSPHTQQKLHNSQSDTTNASLRLPPGYQTGLRHQALRSAYDPNPTEGNSIAAANATAVQVSKKRRHANDNLHFSNTNQKQRRKINDLRKEKNCLRKRNTRSQTKICNLKADLADTQTNLRMQQALHKDHIARLKEEKYAAERQARKAEARVYSQQSQIDALYAKTRAIAIADTRYREKEMTRIETEVAKITEICLLDRGRWSEPARRAVRNLYNVGCSIRSIGKVLTLCSQLLGVNLDGVPSRRSIMRMILEGGVLAELQMIQELMNVDAFVLAGDGTSHEKINYKASSIFLRTPDYNAQGFDNQTVRSRRFLGVRATTSHASAVQQASLDAIVTEMVELYNSIFGSNASIDEIYRKITGTMGDHANDVKKTSRLWKDRKAKAWASKLADDQWKSLPDDELLSILDGERDDWISAAGGEDRWHKLNAEERDGLIKATRAKTMSKLAADRMASLPEEDQTVIRLFIHSGCGAHKLSNIFKYGADAMHASWPEGEGPILLFNKDNQALMDDHNNADDDDADDPGYGDSQRRVIASSHGGGVKVTSLAGGIFNHKDSKKGHQQVHLTYIKMETGSSAPFKTSDNRYASHGIASSELVTRKETYLKFLEMIRDSKDDMRWSNMEKNVDKGLRDPATFTELCAMSLFMECFYHPAFKALRSEEAGLQGNALDQGAFYERVVEFLGAVARDPKMILGNTSHRIATLDSEPWNHPDAVDAVRKAAPSLPYLRQCVAKFFEGARNACPSFLAEFVEGGDIDRATADERKLAFRPPTNDCSEGDLGGFRLFARNRGTKNPLLYNANRQYHENGTEAWDDWNREHTANISTAVSIEARRRLNSGESDKVLENIVAATCKRAAANRRAQDEQREKEKEENDRLTNIPQQTDLAWPSTRGVTKEVLRDQLKKYRQLLGKPEFLGNISGNKESLAEQYTKAVESWINKQTELEGGCAH